MRVLLYCFSSQACITVGILPHLSAVCENITTIPTPTPVFIAGMHTNEDADRLKFLDITILVNDVLCVQESACRPIFYHDGLHEGRYSVERLGLEFEAYVKFPFELNFHGGEATLGQFFIYAFFDLLQNFCGDCIFFCLTWGLLILKV